MKTFLKKFGFLISVFCVLLSLFSCKEKSQPTRTVRIAIQPSAAFIPLYIARYSGQIENALAPKNVTVVWQDFESGPPINESLTADLTDIGVIGDVPTVRALSGATKMRLVGVPASGANAYALLARADNTFLNSYKDLKGKKIATVFGSTGHNFVKKLLEKAGLTFEDIEFVNIQAGQAQQVLSDSSADAVAIWEPNITRLLDNGDAKIVAQGDETNLRGTNGFVVRDEFLADSGDIISEILNQYAIAVQKIPDLNDEMLKKLSSALNISGEQIKSISKKYNFSVEIMNEDILALQDTISFLVSINNLQNEYRVANFVDGNYYKK
ncbi:MAG: ABC transporter substrate-binding protein [Treponema sp.]|nr:ABC transporter substrate-binding protein [Treponema sp.]